jgi:hypothetical protein
MNIIVARPPNFEAILKVFPEAAKPGVMFAWGDTIFSPSSAYVPPQLIAHEEVHQEQQLAEGPEIWWAQYLVSPQFRFDMELRAHIVEYHEFIKHTRSRPRQREYLAAVAKRLSSPLYGSMVTFEHAMKTIRQS